VKSEPKPFASLSSGLLARKGAARPAMRPQGFGQLGSGLEDLGWNDMGFEPPKPADTPERDEEHDAFGEVIPAHPHKLAGLTPVESPVHGQQAEIAGRLSSYKPEDSGEDSEDVDETAELYEPEEEAETRADVDERPVAAVKAPALQVPEVRPERVAKTVRKARAAPGSKGKAAFTLRLDPERHLRLRLACALDGRSAQQLVTKALDDLLQSIPELDSMAAKAKRKG